MKMIPTEPVGSIPRSSELIGAIASQNPNLEKFYENAVESTIREFENTGSPVISDGEQTKPSFVTYPLHGSTDIKEGGMKIPFEDGHFRQLPLLMRGPFRYSNYAYQFLKRAQQFTDRPIKQAVISASALSLIYPREGIEGYPQSAFLEDLINESEKDIRLCLQNNAYKVQMDFTEGRLSLKLDPTGGVLKHFIDLNNRVLSRFTPEEQKKIGIHVCPGGDHDSTHSADVDYTTFLPMVFQLKAGNFYLQMASESDRKKVLASVKQHLRPGQLVFIGVIDVINPRIESAEEVRDRILEAAEYIPLNQLGTTDDCGFSPFCDDVSTTREQAFSKIRSRIEGTKLASELLAKKLETVG